MPLVTFHATPDRQSWTHAKGHTAEVPWGNGTTRKVFPPAVMRDGDEVEMDEFQAAWCLAAYPLSFSVSDAPEPRGSNRHYGESE